MLCYFRYQYNFVKLTSAYIPSTSTSPAACSSEDYSMTLGKLIIHHNVTVF